MTTMPKLRKAAREGYAAVPTIPLSRAQPGDIGLAHESGFVPWAIRVCQRIRAPWVYAQWNHVFILDQDKHGWWVVYEAEQGGTEEALLDTVGEFVIISADSFPTVDGKPVDRARLLAFARDALGAKYGVLTIASIMLNLLTPRFVSFRRPGTLICSAYGMRSLEHGGAISPSDPFQITPAEVAQWAANKTRVEHPS